MLEKDSLNQIIIQDILCLLGEAYKIQAFFCTFVTRSNQIILRCTPWRPTVLKLSLEFFIFQAKIFHTLISDCYVPIKSFDDLQNEI